MLKKIKFRRSFCLAIILVIAVLSISNIELIAQSKVTIQEKPLILPTYGVAPPDKNPIFYVGRTYQGAQGQVYPQAMYDVLTDIRKDQAYNAVYVDNEFTEFCVVPELGGRILSALDKTDQYDFFYRQHVIKPALIGMIGAWLSGGVEWNIPDHHRASSHLPIDYTLQENPDGSKTVWVGETELSRRLKWIVGLTLYPGKSYIEATVKVFNPTPFIQSFLYWANVSVHCNENYQVIFPPTTQFGVQHAKNEFTTWPIGQGMYGGSDRTGIDLSWWKNHPKPASIFAWNFTDDFLAGYDFGKDAGTVHVANHQMVTGKKFFLWGNNPEAKMWEKMLTETDGQYLELMVGAYSDNQPDYSWIAPGETRVFKQYWYPIKKIGGVKKANIDAAVNIERKSPGTIKVGFNSTASFKNAQVIISVANKIIAQETIDIDPATPYLKDFTIEPAVNNFDLNVALFSTDRKELVSYKPVQLEMEDMPQPVERPVSPKEYGSNEELYLTAQRIEQFRNATIDPMPYYEEALNRDSLDYRVNNALGIRFCKEGKFTEAEKYFRSAVKRITKNYTSPKDGEAFYYLGITLLSQNKLKEASDFFWKSTWYNGFQSSAYFNLAQIYCLQNNYNDALSMADQSLITNNLNTASLALKSFILRKLGNIDDAGKMVELVQNIDKLDNWSVCESIFAEMQKAEQKQWSVKNINLFKFRIKGNVQSVLELVQNYGHIGAYREAIQILEQYKKSGEKQSDFPLLSYYLAYYQMKIGNAAEAKKYFAQATQSPSDYCFPFRTEEIEILETAVTENPADAKAYYYLGNLHYYLNQKEKALTDWEQSTKLDDKFYLAFRNLGFAYDQFSHDIEKSIQAYEKAIVLNNQDPRLFSELDVLKERAGISPEQRLLFLENNMTTVEKRDDITSRVIELYNQTGQYDKALDILTKRHFHVWEGGGGIHDVFVDACLLKGLSEINRKQYSNALENFEMATSYPDNLEVGEPYEGGRISEINYFKAQANLGLGNKAKAKEYYEKVVSDKARGQNNSFPFYKTMALQKLDKKDEALSILNAMEQDVTQKLKSNEGLDFFSKFGADASRDNRQSENHFILGMVNLGKGNRKLASEQFKIAIELNRNHIWAKTFMNLMRQNIF